MRRTTFCRAHLVDAQTDRAGADLTIDGAHITSVGASAPMPGREIDASEMLITPGFIEVLTHGGGGYQLHTLDPEEILAYARWAPQTGVSAFLIGGAGVPDALPEAYLRVAVQAIKQWETGAEPLGIHQEGPYLNPLRRGAHQRSWLRLPSTTEIEQILAVSQGQLRMMTLAPELPGAAVVIERLVEAGVTVSIGHTDATYAQTLEAIHLGVTQVTHCYDAMRPLHHREPGPLGAILHAPQVFGTLIADGIHVHPVMIEALVRLLGPQRMIVVTDALAAAGMPENTPFEFAGQPARVINGAAHLADGTLTGSVLTMEQAFRNMLHMTGRPLQEVVGMCTANPAQTAHVAHRKGRLKVGYDADLLLFDQQLHLQATICQGRVAFATERWQERLHEY
jgi:N-acetylglucosamine-6-phosphate deacetylase